MILRDHVLDPPDTLEDAAIRDGGSEHIDSAGIEIEVLEALPDDGGFRLRINYDPPATDYNLWIARGDPDYMSPDIWVDNQADGYDEDNDRVPMPRGERPIAGEENRVYVQVHNAGPAVAHDIEAAFFFSSPYHTVDDEAAFDYFGTATIDRIEGEDSDTIFVTWIPPRSKSERSAPNVGWPWRNTGYG